MITILLIAGALLAAGAIGRASLVRRLQRLRDRKSLAVEFQRKVVEYSENGGSNEAAYMWLLNRRVRMSRELGRYGIATYRPPFSDALIPNWEIVPNAIAEMRRSFNIHLPQQAFAHADMLNAAVVSYGGSLDDAIEEVTAEIGNPVVWLREGVRACLSLPFRLLQWFGLLSETSVTTITGSRAFQIIGGLVGLIGLFSSLVSLILDWGDLLVWLKNLRAVL